MLQAPCSRSPSGVFVVQEKSDWRISIREIFLLYGPGRLARLELGAWSRWIISTAESNPDTNSDRFFENGGRYPGIIAREFKLPASN
jgi:hypothetical protein